jgi:hypothetical protein
MQPGSSGSGSVACPSAVGAGGDAFCTIVASQVERGLPNGTVGLCMSQGGAINDDDEEGLCFLQAPEPLYDGDGGSGMSGGSVISGTNGKCVVGWGGPFCNQEQSPLQVLKPRRNGDGDGPSASTESSTMSYEEVKILEASSGLWDCAYGLNARLVTDGDNSSISCGLLRYNCGVHGYMDMAEPPGWRRCRCLEGWTTVPSLLGGRPCTIATTVTVPPTVIEGCPPDSLWTGTRCACTAGFADNRMRLLASAGDVRVWTLHGLPEEVWDGTRVLDPHTPDVRKVPWVMPDLWELDPAEGPECVAVRVYINPQTGRPILWQKVDDHDVFFEPYPNRAEETCGGGGILVADMNECVCPKGRGSTNDLRWDIPTRGPTLYHPDGDTAEGAETLELPNVAVSDMAPDGPLDTANLVASSMVIPRRYRLKQALSEQEEVMTAEAYLASINVGYVRKHSLHRKYSPMRVPPVGTGASAATQKLRFQQPFGPSISQSSQTVWQHERQGGILLGQRQHRPLAMLAVTDEFGFVVPGWALTQCLPLGVRIASSSTAALTAQDVCQSSPCADGELCVSTSSVGQADGLLGMQRTSIEEQGQVMPYPWFFTEAIREMQGRLNMQPRDQQQQQQQQQQQHQDHMGRTVEMLEDLLRDSQEQHRQATQLYEQYDRELQIITVNGSYPRPVAGRPSNVWWGPVDQELSSPMSTAQRVRDAWVRMMKPWGAEGVSIGSSTIPFLQGTSAGSILELQALRRFLESEPTGATRSQTVQMLAAQYPGSVQQEITGGAVAVCQTPDPLQRLSGSYPNLILGSNRCSNQPLPCGHVGLDDLGARCQSVGKVLCHCPYPFSGPTCMHWTTFPLLHHNHHGSLGNIRSTPVVYDLSEVRSCRHHTQNDSPGAHNVLVDNARAALPPDARLVPTLVAVPRPDTDLGSDSFEPECRVDCLHGLSYNATEHRCVWQGCQAHACDEASQICAAYGDQVICEAHSAFIDTVLGVPVLHSVKDESTTTGSLRRIRQRIAAKGNFRASSDQSGFHRILATQESDQDALTDQMPTGMYVCDSQGNTLRAVATASHHLSSTASPITIEFAPPSHDNGEVLGNNLPRRTTSLRVTTNTVRSSGLRFSIPDATQTMKSTTREEFLSAVGLPFVSVQQALVNADPSTSGYMASDGQFITTPNTGDYLYLVAEPPHPDLVAFVDPDSTGRGIPDQVPTPTQINDLEKINHAVDAGSWIPSGLQNLVTKDELAAQYDLAAHNKLPYTAGDSAIARARARVYLTARHMRSIAYSMLHANVPGDKTGAVGNRMGRVTALLGGHTKWQTQSLAQLVAAVSDKLPSLLSPLEMSHLRTITEGHIIFTRMEATGDLLLLSKQRYGAPSQPPELAVIPTAFSDDPWSLLYLVVRGTGIRSIMWGLNPRLIDTTERLVHESECIQLQAETEEPDDEHADSLVWVAAAIQRECFSSDS